MNEKKNQIQEWKSEFRTSLKRPLKKRWAYSFIHTYKPVLDDAPYRVFKTLREYRQWCGKNLPSWLGYGKNI